MPILKSLTLKKIVDFIFSGFLLLPAILFLFTGFQWIVAPDKAALFLAMPLLRGAGLSSQIGDVGGIFLAMGLLILIAYTTRKREYLLSVSLILTCIATFRLLAFTLYGATLIFQMFIFEMVLALWFYVASLKLNAKGAGHGK